MFIDAEFGLISSGGLCFIYILHDSYIKYIQFHLQNIELCWPQLVSIVGCIAFVGYFNVAAQLAYTSTKQWYSNTKIVVFQEIL